jgi:hypothetical protein
MGMGSGHPIRMPPPHQQSANSSGSQIWKNKYIPLIGCPREVGDLKNNLGKNICRFTDEDDHKVSNGTEEGGRGKTKNKNTKNTMQWIWPTSSTGVPPFEDLRGNKINFGNIHFQNIRPWQFSYFFLCKSANSKCQIP